MFDHPGVAFNNPSITWKELERRLSDRPSGADGGDSPAWSAKRDPYTAPTGTVRHRGVVPYAELHCHSNFSFLDGASHPHELVEEAARLGLEALALTDHNGFYGVVRFAEAAKEVGLPTVFGAELTLGATERRMGGTEGVPDPDGCHLVVLARGPAGYARLGTAISQAQMAGNKARSRTDLASLSQLAAGHWLVLTGCRKGPLTRALERDGPAAARRALADLVQAFGVANVAVELWDHGHPLDSIRNDALAEIAAYLGVTTVATGNVHYATPAHRPLATAIAAVRSRRSLDDAQSWLPAGTGQHLRSGAEQARRFVRYPGVVERAAELGRDCAFDLALVAPELPPFPCPEGLDEMTYLRRLTEAGAAKRYGSRHAPTVPVAWAQIDHELDVIEGLGFPGYFLVVWDIVQFCRDHDILCQGRGSAANSAVCFALGITAADTVRLGLLFERFLSPGRDGPPDIDIDIESDRREEVIQYVYQRHGRTHAAQVANVITYRGRSAVRDMGKALGHDQAQVDTWSKRLDAPDPDIPDAVVDLASRVKGFPRHLGIHSGGMVICDRPIAEVCPTEWATMEGRSVLQWDKDDCAAIGLVKFDLLGLGMLSAIHYCVDLIAHYEGIDVDLATIPQDDAVYDMLCAADTVGVFQVESRAQMATLPRLRPRVFYDLVVEVALIRPGPIQGGSVHPYIRRRRGEEPITYLHPSLEPALRKTLGVPLFQEQLMQIAIDVAGFTPTEADQLRQAMGSKRSVERMERIRGRLFDGMAERDIPPDVAEQIWEKLVAFSAYGFPESHSVSFAYLVYASAWLKLHHPAAFCAALLNAQPMGFYSPNSLCQDARRHGVVVHGPDIAHSEATATLDPCPDSTGGWAVRLGMASIRGIGDDLAETIAFGRPYTSMEDLVRRTGISRDRLEAMATAGAFTSLGLDRRPALWAAGAAIGGRPDRLPGVVVGGDAPRLPGMSPVEETVADLWATGVAVGTHPMGFLRERLAAEGIVAAADLGQHPDNGRITVAGIVTHRQRPATASGTTFMSLEDETGLINVVCSKGCWARHRRVARDAPAVVISGRLEHGQGAMNVIAERITPLAVAASTSSRDFR
ncbi:MAG TPA: error-prone DNA polymerase [Acidimicrobiales bacterium]